MPDSPDQIYPHIEETRSMTLKADLACLLFVLIDCHNLGAVVATCVSSAVEQGLGRWAHCQDGTARLSSPR